MITKFKSITTLAIFQNFDWDTTIHEDGNNIVLFKPINIFYGRKKGSLQLNVFGLLKIRSSPEVYR